MKAIAQTCTVTLEIDRETMIVFLNALADAAAHSEIVAAKCNTDSLEKSHLDTATVYKTYLKRLSQFRDSTPMRLDEAIARLRKRGEL